MRRATLLLCLLLASSAATAEEPVAAPLLTAESYAGLRSAIAPTPEESAWRDVGWLPTFGEAVAEARRARKPIFLWAMNGHPLACV